MTHKTPLANHTLKRFVAAFNLALVAFSATACASPTTQAPTLSPTNTFVPTALPTPTTSLFQQPVIQQPIIAPTVAMPGGVISTPTLVIDLSGTPTSTPSATATPMAKVFGQLQSSGPLSLQPIGLGWQALFGTNRPQAGNIFFFINLAVQSNSQVDLIQFNPTQFVLIDSNGAPVAVESLAGVENQLRAVTLQPGEHIQGIIIYEVPLGQEQAKWTLQFRSGIPLAWSING